MRYSLDTSGSTFEIFTSADGLLARLAHDLRLSVTVGELQVERDGEHTTVRARVHTDALRVDGVMKDGALRETVLSAHDREEILAKMRTEVFGGRDGVVELDGKLQGESFTAILRAPTGRSAKVSCKVSLRTEAERAHVQGAFEVSLKGLAGHDIKGPLGAFRVSDHVRVTFDARFVHAG